MARLDLFLLMYRAFGGRIEGKTNLQKRIFFLATLLDSDLGYRPHYFGPYSAEVASANEELKSLGFLQETPFRIGVYNRLGFEIVRYDYTLTEVGRRIAEKVAELEPEREQRIMWAADQIRNAGDLDYLELSVAAKAYFILSHRGRPSTLKEIEEIAPKFGWQVTGDGLRKAAGFLENLDLVEAVSTGQRG